MFVPLIGLKTSGWLLIVKSISLSLKSFFLRLSGFGKTPACSKINCQPSYTITIKILTCFWWANTIYNFHGDSFGITKINKPITVTQNPKSALLAPFCIHSLVKAVVLMEFWWQCRFCTSNVGKLFLSLFRATLCWSFKKDIEILQPSVFSEFQEKLLR